MIDSRNSFLECVASLIRPIVRFCLRRSLTFKDLVPIVKKIFVEEARSELEAQNVEVSASKLSVMTGLQRPDVSTHLTSRTSSREASVAARVVNQWCNDRRYTNEHGQPKDLELTGRASQFAKLVASVSKDLNSYAVLFDLERLGLVRRKEDFVQLVTSGVVESKDMTMALRFLGNDIQDLIGAVEQNMEGSKVTPNLHVKVHYDNIVIEALPEIRGELIRRGSVFIKEIQSYLAGFDKDLNPELASKEGGARVALGSYSISQDSGSR